MRECMPFYYQVVDGHGNGAEHVMQGETEFMRGNMPEAQISYHLAVGASNRRNQHSIRITAEFLAMRMALFEGDGEKLRSTLENQRSQLREQKQYILLNTLDMCETWILSLLGHTENVPAWIAGGAPLSMVMYPAAPMLQIIYNQYLLAQGRWAELAARREESEKLFESTHVLLCAIYLRIQLAAAFEKLSRQSAAEEELTAALETALPDGIIIPFAENCGYIAPVLQRLKKRKVFQKQIGGIQQLAERCGASRQRILRELWNEEQYHGLTERELETARLAAARLTNKEIAEKLHISEGTVKNNLKRVFDKLGLEGAARNKRNELERLIRPEK